MAESPLKKGFPSTRLARAWVGRWEEGKRGGGGNCDSGQSGEGWDNGLTNCLGYDCDRRKKGLMVATSRVSRLFPSKVALACWTKADMYSKISKARLLVVCDVTVDGRGGRVWGAWAR